MAERSLTLVTSDGEMAPPDGEHLADAIEAWLVRFEPVEEPIGGAVTSPVVALGVGTAFAELVPGLRELARETGTLRVVF